LYNTGGYDSVETLRLLEGTVDIYMPDMKYASDDTAVRYSGASGYVAANRAAVKEMRRQVGELDISSDGTALKGLLVRHLILPGLAQESKQILDFIAREFSTETRVSLMSQYHPAHRADKHPELSRRITTREYEEVIEHAEKLGLENVYIQYL
ncbi:MAG: radical SAM protein, partial [Endomicrobiia bacterium]|nr:radical SAM protein [Endomicrobiia bacterium]